MVLMLRRRALSLWTWDSAVDALGRNGVAFLYSFRDLKEVLYLSHFEYFKNEVIDGV